MPINPLAKKLNEQINNENSAIYDLLTPYGRRLYFPKGIVSQSNEAKKSAHLFNATIGIATENNAPMHLLTVKHFVADKFKVNEVFPYAPSSGLLPLRKLWQQRQRNLNQSITQSSMPVVTNALTHGLSLIGDLFINPEDTVIVPDKFWGNYRLMWEVNKQAKFEFFPTFNENLQAFNTNSLTKILLDKPLKKAIVVLNFPNNPTGYTVTKSEAKQIKEILHTAAMRGTNLVIICDDAYWGLTYENDCEKESFFGELANCHKNILTIKIDGCTKEHFMWGFRVGFITFGSKDCDQAYQALESKVSGAIRGNISNVNHHGQTLLLKALQQPSIETEIIEKRAILKKRYEKVKEVVYNKEYSKFWDVYPFNSGYFMCLRLKTVTAEKLRIHLLSKHGIGTISTGEKDLRVAFSCLNEKDIELLFKMIANASEELA